MRRTLAAACLMLASACGPSADQRTLDRAEPVFADYLDAAGAIDTIESGVREDFDGASLQIWRQRFEASEAALQLIVTSTDDARLTQQGRRSLATIRSALALRADSEGPGGRCEDAQSPSAAGAALRAALYACFDSIGGALPFEGGRIGRLDAFGLMEDASAARRRAAFLALGPLTSAINGDNGAASPYRRMIALERERMRANIAAAEAALGVAPGAGAQLLERALTTWHETLPYADVEAWDLRAAFAGFDVAFAACAGRERLLEANAHFYRDLGADLDALGVIADVEGDEPVAYADFARIGREVDGAWRPAVPRLTMVLGEDASIGSAAELVHESGHAAQYAAIRARPTLTLPDDLTMAVEAFADVTAWSVYEPAWQRKYLGCSAERGQSQRARLFPIMMDMAWGLFEMRMADDPARDPNATWNEIMQSYFRVKPHAEYAWWAVRGQLVEEPGYMVNYALGAFVTADLRARVREEIGAFDAGNPEWFGFMSRRLYVYGGERAPRDLLRDFLGRDVSPNTFNAEIAALQR